MVVMEHKLSYVESISWKNIQNFELAEQKDTVGMKFRIYYRSQDSLLE